MCATFVVVKCAARTISAHLSVRKRTTLRVCARGVLRDKQYISLARLWTRVACNKTGRSDQAPVELQEP